MDRHRDWRNPGAPEERRRATWLRWAIHEAFEGAREHPLEGRVPFLISFLCGCAGMKEPEVQALWDSLRDAPTDGGDHAEPRKRRARSARSSRNAGR